MVQSTTANLENIKGELKPTTIQKRLKMTNTYESRDDVFFLASDKCMHSINLPNTYVFTDLGYCGRYQSG